MRDLLRGALVGVLVAFANVAAFADEGGNNLTITGGDPLMNGASLQVSGSANTLSLSQTSPAGALRGNRIEVSILGDANGAARLDGPAPLMATLPWGTLAQSGEGNAMTLSVSGEANLLAALQTGEGHLLRGEVAGTANQAAILQTGASNTESFSMVGHGNMVSISQTSW